MNKRILELAFQAKLGPALLLHHWGNVDALTDYEQGELKQIEKFAELIVKECLSVQNKCPHDIAAGKFVRNHFGVEECTTC